MNNLILIKPIAVYIAPESLQRNPNVGQIQEEISKTYDLVTASLDKRGLASCLKGVLRPLNGRRISLLILDGPSGPEGILLGKKSPYLRKNVHPSDFIPFLNPKARVMVIGVHSAILASKISQVTDFESFGFKHKVVKGSKFALTNSEGRVEIFSLDENGKDSTGCYFQKGAQYKEQTSYSKALLRIQDLYLLRKMAGVCSALAGLKNERQDQIDFAVENLGISANEGDPVSKKYLMILAKRGDIGASRVLFRVFMDSNDTQKAASLLKQRREFLEFPLAKLERKSVI